MRNWKPAFEVTLPLFDNMGALLIPAHQKFREAIVELCGGVTAGPEENGYWKAPSGRVIAEPVMTYRFSGDVDLDVVETKLAELFPDQHSFYIHQTGQAAVVERATIGQEEWVE